MPEKKVSYTEANLRTLSRLFGADIDYLRQNVAEIPDAIIPPAPRVEIIPTPAAPVVDIPREELVHSLADLRVEHERLSQIISNYDPSIEAAFDLEMSERLKLLTALYDRNLVDQTDIDGSIAVSAAFQTGDFHLAYQDQLQYELALTRANIEHGCQEGHDYLAAIRELPIVEEDLLRIESLLKSQTGEVVQACANPMLELPEFTDDQLAHLNKLTAILDQKPS